MQERSPATCLFGDVRHFRQVDSTNRVAADLAREGAAEGLVVVADHQTAGRGRRGRSWHAQPGSSLLASVVLRPRPDVAQSDLVMVACALAAADACGDAAGFVPDLKWPNDLVVRGRKLAGLLAELVMDPRRVGPAVVVGLGLNVAWTGPGLASGAGGPLPDELAGRAVTAEAVAGRPVDRRTLLDAYLSRLERRWTDLATGGTKALLEDYRCRCVTLGRPVRVDLPGGQVLEGVATGVDEDASLLVSSAGTETRVTAGDVVHLDGPSPWGDRSSASVPG
ncbi:MAG: biotin--[acetyl-CoA-carboxylase] ligase [Acidimicrobiales bacterium]